MDHALDLGMAAADGLLAVQVGALTRQQLSLGVVRVQQLIDRFTLAHARFLSAADKAGVWQGTGARDMADWLTNTTQTSYGNAKGLLELGETVDASPEVSAAVAAGELSAASATTLHDAVTNAPANADIAELVNAVKGAKPTAARKAADRWKELNATTPETEEEREDRRYQRRAVRAGQPVDGMVTTTVTLPALQSRQFINAINFVTGTPGQGDTRTTEQRLADGLVMLCDALAKGQVKGGRERPTVLLVFDVASYLGETDAPARTANGDRIPACVARHLAENALLQRVTEAGSRILDLGSVVRLASDDQYRALLVRDGGCRWPGCEIPAAWCEADHLVPYPAGPTNLDNLVLWCCGALIITTRSTAPVSTSWVTHTRCASSWRTGPSLTATYEEHRRRPDARQHREQLEPCGRARCGVLTGAPGVTGCTSGDRWSCNSEPDSYTVPQKSLCARQRWTTGSAYRQIWAVTTNEN